MHCLDMQYSTSQCAGLPSTKLLMQQSQTQQGLQPLLISQWSLPALALVRLLPAAGVRTQHLHGGKLKLHASLSPDCPVGRASHAAQRT